jgi:hypothetical protein
MQPVMSPAFVDQFILRVFDAKFGYSRSAN